MDLDNLLKNSHTDIEYGSVAIFIKKHGGKISNVDANRFYTHKVQDNKQALQIVATLLKGIMNSKETGSLTFTIEHSKGESRTVIVQDNKKHRVI